VVGVHQSNELDLWIAGTDLSTRVIESLHQTLDQREKAQAVRFRLPEHRSRYIAAHGILRSVLANYLETAPSQIEFEHNSYGKPFLAGTTDRSKVSFNMSHTNALVAVAVAWNRQVGVDIEYIQTTKEMDDIANRYFPPDECRMLADAPANSRPQIFHMLWSRKEALLKAAGVGLSESLDTLDISKYWVCDLSVPPGYAGAVALSDGPAEIRYLSWNLSDKST
jgi:4'-phosphopantetheinyl transferase